MRRKHPDFGEALRVAKAIPGPRLDREVIANLCSLAGVADPGEMMALVEGVAQLQLAFYSAQLKPLSQDVADVRRRSKRETVCELYNAAARLEEALGVLDDWDS